HPLLLTLDEDQDDQKIAKWVTVHPPISGQFSPVADSCRQPPPPLLVACWSKSAPGAVYAGDCPAPDVPLQRVTRDSLIG
ncbi:hypothetical protein, partial [Streptomyces sp. NPDC001978]|uniref:hypothetical protein n=1 Tax=Streptomyces sp. NPDC001978 TaxID=3364627 RepID=UPI0036AE0A06